MHARHHDPVAASPQAADTHPPTAPVASIGATPVGPESSAGDAPEAGQGAAGAARNARQDAAMARFVEGPTRGGWAASIARLGRYAKTVADRFRSPPADGLDDAYVKGDTPHPRVGSVDSFSGRRASDRLRQVAPKAWLFAVIGLVVMVSVVVLVAGLFGSRMPAGIAPPPRSAPLPTRAVVSPDSLIGGATSFPLAGGTGAAPVGTMPVGTMPVGTTPTVSDVAPHGSVIVVHAAGAVVRPGLYRLPSDSRVADLVRAAGGLAVDADDDRINLAASVADGIRVYIPRRGELGAPPTVSGPDGPAPPGVGSAVGSGGGSAVGSGGGSLAVPVDPVNLNTATLEQLDTLPGVGPSTAQAIVAHRQQHGAFTSVEQLQDVRGIGPNKLAQLRSLVVV